MVCEGDVKRRGYEEAREARTVRTCETNHGTHGLRLSPLLLLTALHVLPSPLVTHLRPSSFGSCLVSEVRREERAVSRMNDTRRRTEERDMETEVGPVTVPFTSLFMNGPGLSPLVTSVVRDRLTTFPLPFTP